MNDFYDDLGVSRTASADEIKTAYRHRARATHPDLGGCREEFQRLQRAYEVLSNAEARARYDAHGEAEGDPTVPLASAMLTKLFADVVDQPPAGFAQYSDVLLRTASGLKREVADHTQALAEMRSELARLRGILGRLERKGGEPLLEGVLKTRIEPLERNAKRCVLMLARLTQAGELLKEYGYRKVLDGMGAGDEEKTTRLPARQRRRAA